MRVHRDRLRVLVRQSVADVDAQNVADFAFQRRARDCGRAGRRCKAFSHKLIDEGAEDARPGDRRAVPDVAPRTGRDDVPKRGLRFDPILNDLPTGLRLGRLKLKLIDGAGTGRYGSDFGLRAGRLLDARGGGVGLCRVAGLLDEDVLAADSAEEGASAGGKEAAATDA